MPGLSSRRRYPRRRAAKEQMASLYPCPAYTEWRMGAPGGLVPPSIEGIPTELGSTSCDGTAVELARTLLVLGIADPSDWAASGRTAGAFVDTTFARLFARHGGETIERVFALQGIISPAELGPETDHVCHLMIRADAFGYVKLGQTFDRLERFKPRLAATFYSALVHALSVLGRPFGYEDACEYQEMVIDGISPDELTDYELPDLSLCCRPAYSVAPHRCAASITRAFGGSPAINERQWIRAALALEQRAEALAKALPNLCPGDWSDRFDFEGDTVPFVLLVNTEGDGIQACFDDQTQGWGEYEGPPMLLAEFAATDHQSVATTIRTYTDFLDVLCDASALLQMLPGNDYQPADQQDQQRRSANTPDRQVYG